MHRWGAQVECHPMFANRVNASFARVRDDDIEVAVYERGVGPTQACGSAACAVGALAVRAGLGEAGVPMAVRLPGGVLRITCGTGFDVVMRGPASRVFEGTSELLP
jgi:diaminopimelate epimerase